MRGSRRVRGMRRDRTCAHAPPWLAILPPAARSRSLARPAPRRRVPGARSCPIFPAHELWNKRVDRAAGRRRTRPRMISAIGLDAPVHPDFGSFLGYGIPYNVVVGHSTRARCTSRSTTPTSPTRSPTRCPRTRTSRAAATGTCCSSTRDSLQALRAVRRAAAAARAGRPARAPIWNLRSNHLRPNGWTSADAAGPADPARARALRRGRRRRDPPRAALHRRRGRASAHIYPARHDAGDADAIAAADGPARAPQGLGRHLAASASRRASSCRRSRPTG